MAEQGDFFAGVCVTILVWTCEAIVVGSMVGSVVIGTVVAAGVDECSSGLREYETPPLE